MKRNTFKKLMAVVLCMMMALSTLVIIPMGASAEEENPDAWDGVTFTDWFLVKGSGTEADPYLIEKPADFAAMMNAYHLWGETDRYMKITNDLDFGGFALPGISKKDLSIKLDGQGHTLSNVTTYYGLFDYAAEGTVIKNIRFVNFQSSQARNVTGLIMNVMGQTLIENVIFDATSKIECTAITGNSTFQAAAFVNIAQAGVTIRNCVNQATVIGGYQAGAFIGGIWNPNASGAAMVVENCINMGKVIGGYDEATGAVNTYKAGAIVGGLVGATATNVFHLTIKNSVNLGQVICGSTIQSTAGGILGSPYHTPAQANGASSITIENCYNAGEIKGVQCVAVVGGVVGMFYYGGTVNLKNLYNVGDVVAEQATTTYSNSVVGFGTGGEYEMNFQNLYGLYDDSYTMKDNATLEDATYSPIGCPYREGVWQLQEYCDMVVEEDSEITLATTDGTRTSTIKDEIAAIMAIAHPEHKYELACSAECYVCGYERDVEHTGKYACSTECQYCGTEITASGNHERIQVCSEVCMICNEYIGLADGVNHTVSSACDTICNLCTGAVTPTENHTAADPCSNKCDACQTTITPAHKWENPCDLECDCGARRPVTAIEHTASGDCDEKCDYCGETLMPMSSHMWGQGVVTTPATHTEKGVKTYTCSGCGDTKTADVAKTTEHEWDNGTVTTPATHTTEGVKTFTCACGETKTEAVAKTTEHEWGEGVVTTPATEEAEGVKTFTCACGETKTEAIAKLPASTPETPDEPSEPGDNTGDTNTDAPATDDNTSTEEPAEEAGCGASVAGLGALLALTASFGFAFVGKKED